VDLPQTRFFVHSKVEFIPGTFVSQPRAMDLLVMTLFCLGGANAPNAAEQIFKLNLGFRRTVSIGLNKEHYD
jgi:hypothetical protein